MNCYGDTGKCQLKPRCANACALRVQPVIDALASLDYRATPMLKSIGEQIGFGNAQHILGQLWDQNLKQTYGVPAGRGAMGVSCNEASAYKLGWDACMEQWAKHMKRMASAIKEQKCAVLAAQAGKGKA